MKNMNSAFFRFQFVRNFENNVILSTHLKILHYLYKTLIVTGQNVEKYKGVWIFCKGLYFVFVSVGGSRVVFYYGLPNQFLKQFFNISYLTQTWRHELEPSAVQSILVFTWLLLYMFYFMHVEVPLGTSHGAEPFGASELACRSNIFTVLTFQHWNGKKCQLLQNISGFMLHIAETYFNCYGTFQSNQGWELQTQGFSDMIEMLMMYTCTFHVNYITKHYYPAPQRGNGDEKRDLQCFEWKQ